jgi:hypothetical protein
MTDRSKQQANNSKLVQSESFTEQLVACQLTEKTIWGKNQRKILVLAALIITLLIAKVVPIDKYGDFGTVDFIEYWTAYQLFTSGQDPYDPELMHQQQLALARFTPQPLMMWNPPWTLSLMAPVLKKGFLRAASWWLALNFMAAVLSGWLLASLCNDSNRSKFVGAAAALCLYPVYLTLMVGQVSIMVTLGVAGAIWAIKNNKDLTAGAFLMLVTLKPHIPYLILILLAFFVLRERKFKVLVSFFLCLAALISFHYIAYPQGLHDWMASLDQSKTHPKLIRLGDWQVASLVGWLRLSIAYVFSTSAPIWPMAVVPGVAIIVTALFSLKRRSSMHWEKVLPPLCCISLLTSPYGWLFDHSLLIIAQVILVVKVAELGNDLREVIIGLIPLLALQGLIVSLRLLGANQHHYFFWVPIAMLFIWYSLEKNYFAGRVPT